MQKKALFKWRPHRTRKCSLPPVLRSHLHPFIVNLGSLTHYKAVISIPCLGNNTPTKKSSLLVLLLLFFFLPSPLSFFLSHSPFFCHRKRDGGFLRHRPLSRTGNQRAASRSPVPSLSHVNPLRRVARLVDDHRGRCQENPPASRQAAAAFLSSKRRLLLLHHQHQPRRR